MTEEKINRINELYHKAKGEGLTAGEKEEQQVLRKEFFLHLHRKFFDRDRCVFIYRILI